MKSFIYWFIAQIAKLPVLDQTETRRLELHPGLFWVTGFSYMPHLPLLVSGVLVGSQIGSGTFETQTGAHMGCQCHSQHCNPLSTRLSPELFFFFFLLVQQMRFVCSGSRLCSCNKRVINVWICVLEDYQLLIQFP